MRTPPSESANATDDASELALRVGGMPDDLPVYETRKRAVSACESPLVVIRK